MRLQWQSFIPWVCEQRQKASETNAELCTPSWKIKELVHHNATCERNLCGLNLSGHLSERRLHPSQSFFWTSLEEEFAILSQNISQVFPSTALFSLQVNYQKLISRKPLSLAQEKEHQFKSYHLRALSKEVYTLRFYFSINGKHTCQKIDRILLHFERFENLTIPAVPTPFSF